MTLAWPTTAHSALNAAKADLHRVTSIVAIANGLATASREVDLSGLESAAGALCARVLDLPPAEGHALRPELIELDEKLRRLIAAIGPIPE